MATTGAHEIVEVEREVGTLVKGLEVVNVETRRAVAAEEAGDATAMAVALASESASSVPLGRVVEGVLVHHLSLDQCNQWCRMTNAYTPCTSPGSVPKNGIPGRRFWKTPATRGECPGRRITTIRIAWFVYAGRLGSLSP